MRHIASFLAVLLLLAGCSGSAEDDEATTPPIMSDCDQLVNLLQTGMATFDYQPAGSYQQVRDQAMVAVRGTIDHIARARVNGRWFTEIDVSGVTDLAGNPVEDLSTIAFSSAWVDRDVPDPLATAISVRGVEFLGFLIPWSGVRGGWNPGVEGLYVSCPPGNEVRAVIQDGAGPDDPNPATIDLITAALEFGQPESEPEPESGSEQPGPEQPGSERGQPEPVPEPEDGQAEAPSDAVDSVPGVEEIRDALIQFGRGEDLAIEEIPLATEVALGLGSTIDRIVSKDTLRDQGQWAIDRPEGYAQFVGPFSALETLAAGPETQIILGEHNHCAGPPLPTPDGYSGHVQVSIQPAEGTIDSCIQWFAVDLFLEPDTMAIGAVTLALFGP